MFNVFPLLHAVVGLVALGVVIAEETSEPGTGEEKKAKVIASVQEQLPEIADDLGVPGVLVTVFTKGPVLGLLIDLVVDLAKKAGSLKLPEGTPAAQGQVRS